MLDLIMSESNIEKTDGCGSGGRGLASFWGGSFGVGEGGWGGGGGGSEGGRGRALQSQSPKSLQSPTPHLK